ncbi:MAG: metallophosphoesterase, partial [Desulfobacteraceae bacterium]|nr:metallophosphoesterase [Desulfobacteraceae bacterium]
NHEYYKGKLCKHWKKIFKFPKNGPKGLKNTTYYIDYQDVRIISLDSNAKIEPQTKWLRNVLKENDNKWTIIAFHHPVYFVSKSRDPKKLRNTWLPIIDEYGVDLILQGHDHAYVRTDLVKFNDKKFDGIESNMDEGTIYAVSVSGPKMYDPVISNAVMKRKAANTQLYQLININENNLHYEAKTADGEIYDAFTLTKQPNGKKILTDEIPVIPERK